MKSVENICCDNKKELTYPRLMLGRSGSVWLILKVIGNYAEGTIVLKRGPQDRTIGCQANKIWFADLEDYYGTITLSND